MEGHVSVLLNESIGLLNVRSGHMVVDGTLGGGGHTQEILRLTSPDGFVVGIDKDGQAIERTRAFLSAYAGRFRLVHDDFKNIKRILGGEQADAAILDLGVSSFQLDDGARGFSYQSDAKLDMRMDAAQALSALDVVNGYTEQRLRSVILDYGEERWAARIAKFIVERRKSGRIETTGELTDVIKAAIPKDARRDGPHPAKRTFQAIRIEVNGELAHLSAALEDFCDVLKPGGRMAVITFHSLEDRIVKQTFARLVNPCTCPSDAPICMCGKTPKAKHITRKPVLPSEEEVRDNPRSRSAKLRVIERI